MFVCLFVFLDGNWKESAIPNCLLLNFSSRLSVVSQQVQSQFFYISVILFNYLILNIFFLQITPRLDVLRLTPGSGHLVFILFQALDYKVLSLIN